MGTVSASLVERRVPHFAILYVGVAWGFVQFTDFMVDEFLLSPHWTRVALATALLLLPSVLMLAYFHGRPGSDQFVTTEKLGVPANMAITAVVLVFLFGGKDLGSAVTTVTVETEDGETIERVIAKSEFRKRTALFAFDTGPGLSEEDDWLSYIIPYALEMDLAADDFFEPLSLPLMKERLQEAGFQDLRGAPLTLQREAAEDFHAEFLVSGTVDRSDDGYQITMAVHEVDRGKLLEELEYGGADVLALVDEMSIDLKDVLEIPDRDHIEDLPVSERLTSDGDALEAYGWALRSIIVDSDFPGAIEHLAVATEADPTFADAQHTLGAALLFSNRVQEAVEPMQAALNNVYRLPERAQFAIKSDYYFTTQQTQKAWAVIEMWAELYPDDMKALQNIFMVQGIKNDREGQLTTLRTMFELNPRNTGVLKQMASIHGAMGSDDEALAALEEYVSLNPEDHTSYTGLADFHRRQGAHDVAREHLDRALLMEPGLPELVQSMAALDRDVGRFEEAGAGYDRALQMARTPQERAAGYASLQGYHKFRGEMASSIEAMDAWFVEASSYTPAFMLVMSRFGDIDTYFMAGRGEEGIALFEELSSQLQPPMDTFIPFGELMVALELEDLEAARAAHARAVQAMEAMGMEMMRASLTAAQGKIDELAEDYAAAVENYRQAMELEPARAADLHVSEGRALRGLGELDEAETSLREALRFSPSSPTVHLELAYVLEEKGDIAGAIDHLKSALVAWEHADEVFEPAREAREKLEELGT